MSPICDSVHSRGSGGGGQVEGVSLTETPRQTPPDRDSPWTETLPDKEPPVDREPPDRDPLDREPPDRDPCMVKSGWYTVYWNAFLFEMSSHHNLYIKSKLFLNDEK